MNELQTIPTDNIPAKLDIAAKALSEATTDWQRVEIRDQARALAAAAAILKRKDIQIKAANLVQDAERTIAKANPPMTREETGRGHKVGLGEPDFYDSVSKNEIKHIRDAHNNLTNEEFESAKEEAVKKEEPLTRSKLKKIVKDNKKKKEKENWTMQKEEKHKTSKLTNVELILSSCIELHKHVPENSVDIILTDPPYKPDTLSCYRDLAEFAVHALKPNGILLAMAGTSHLPDVMNYLCNTENLKYHWTLNYLMPGSSLRFHTRAVRMGWKPVIWLVKGKSDGTDRFDVITAPALSAQDTRFHEWGQNEGGFKLLLELFAFPGQVVCDPFLGGGTTGVVAKQLGCKIIGADIEKECLDISRLRILDV